MTTDTGDIDATAERTGALLDRGQQAYEQGLLEEAIEHLEAAVEQARRLVRDLPQDRTFRQGLGSVLYSLGGAYITARRFTEAVTVLTEGLAVYRELSADALVADVHARRGMAHALAGAGATAVTEVQAAIIGFVRRAALDRFDDDYVSLSRVLMLGADVLGAYADPTVGLTAAQTGLTLCVNGIRAGEITPDGALQTAMVRALSVERELLHALNRPAEAGNAEGTLQWLGAEPMPTLVAERLAGDSPGLLLPVADAVAAAGDPELAGLLLGEPVGPLCAPAFRVPAPRLTEAGLTAADAAVRLMPGDPDAAVRLGLEAHFLLDVAHEDRPPEDATRALWTGVLDRMRSQCETDGDTALAADLAACGRRIVDA
ncbi:tetratricopeptide repeat protein [Actinoplanes sp. NPDC051475]|uniref:tetratricopeptide repeat protein n=1 Tax=Actinoplanes sp. NPDC051475 TaxID=3157225 RepID=UPI00344E8E24